MKKFLFLAAILTLALALPALAAQPPVPDKPLELKGSKKTVMFPHAPHQKVECVTCHHPVQDKENFQKCATAGCHDDLTAKKGESIKTGTRQLPVTVSIAKADGTWAYGTYRATVELSKK